MGGGVRVESVVGLGEAAGVVQEERGEERCLAGGGTRRFLLEPAQVRERCVDVAAAHGEPRGELEGAFAHGLRRLRRQARGERLLGLGLALRAAERPGAEQGELGLAALRLERVELRERLVVQAACEQPLDARDAVFDGRLFLQGAEPLRGALGLGQIGMLAPHAHVLIGGACVARSFEGPGER